MNPPLTLAMLKMEKNFVAHIEKNYPRKPYEEYPIFIRGEAERSLIGFVWREMIELNKAVDLFEKYENNFNCERVKTDFIRAKRAACQGMQDQIIAAMWEVADVSNTLDYLFEGLAQALKEWEGNYSG